MAGSMATPSVLLFLSCRLLRAALFYCAALDCYLGIKCSKKSLSTHSASVLVCSCLPGGSPCMLFKVFLYFATGFV